MVNLEQTWRIDAPFYAREARILQIFEELVLKNLSGSEEEKTRRKDRLGSEKF